MDGLIYIVQVKEYNNKNMIGILKTFSYLASDKTYRKK